jgi:hypothetical protein
MGFSDRHTMTARAKVLDRYRDAMGALLSLGLGAAAGVAGRVLDPE